MASKPTEVQEIHLLKTRVRELEDEVTKYKKRLEDLRKAKNTTVTKREREVVEVGGPNLGRRRISTDDARVPALEKQIETMRKRHEQEIEDLQKSKSIPQSNIRCNHEEVIANLRSTLENLETHTSLLEIENSDLKERVESLVHELSIKEAQWCETEESFKLKLKQQWGEKYAEWMAETERKLAELQQANNLMRTLLKKQGKHDGVLPNTDGNPGPAV